MSCVTTAHSFRNGVLQSHGPRPGGVASVTPVLRLEIGRGAVLRRDAHRTSSAGRAAVRGLPRRQPDARAPRPDHSPSICGARPAGVEPVLLPRPDIVALRERPARGLRLCQRRVPRRSACLLAERSALRSPGVRCRRAIGQRYRQGWPLRAAGVRRARPGGGSQRRKFAARPVALSLQR